MFALNVFIWLLSQVKIAKDGRYYVVINNKAHFLKKCVLVQQAPVVKTTAVVSFTKIHPVLGEVRVVTNTPMP